MTDLFLASHNDDETLFGAFTIIRHKPHVVVCFQSRKQESLYGITASVREAETNQALWNLGPSTWEQLLIPDTNPDEMRLGYDLELLDTIHKPERVWAPALELGGHDQHNAVGQVALDVFGHRVRPYLTYVRGRMRTVGVEVPFEPSWVARKMRALSCYQSQIALTDDCQPWFMDDTLREYTP